MRKNDRCFLLISFKAQLKSLIMALGKSVNIKKELLVEINKIPFMYFNMTISASIIVCKKVYLTK